MNLFKCTMICAVLAAMFVSGCAVTANVRGGASVNPARATNTSGPTANNSDVFYTQDEASYMPESIDGDGPGKPYPEECYEAGKVIPTPLTGSRETQYCVCVGKRQAVYWSEVIPSAGKRACDPTDPRRVKVFKAEAVEQVDWVEAQSSETSVVGRVLTELTELREQAMEAATAAVSKTSGSLTVMYKCEDGEPPQRQLCNNGVCNEIQRCAGENLKCLDDPAAQTNTSVPPCLCADGKAPTHHLGQAYICTDGATVNHMPDA